MSQKHLNLTYRAWRNLHRTWHPRMTPALLWQSFVSGTVLSWANATQLRATESARRSADLHGALVIVGYWRSGTSLLHELLAASGRWNYPTTHACMNPQSFALGHAAVQSGRTVHRPMDDMVITANTPQEDEFALLGLGARSPYEALLFPDRLAEALKLASIDRLPAQERDFWVSTLSTFLGNVAATQDARPLLLKSPPHGCRIAALRRTLPGCKFVVIVRDPYEVFESAVRMWRTLFGCYALTAVPTDDAIRATLLAHRPDYENDLRAGLKTLAPDEYTILRFEDLVATPEATVASIYRDLQLDGAETAGAAAAMEMRRRASYTPTATRPTPVWRQKIAETWGSVFSDYGYQIKD